MGRATGLVPELGALAEGLTLVGEAIGASAGSIEVTCEGAGTGVGALETGLLLGKPGSTVGIFVGAFVGSLCPTLFVPSPLL